VVVYISTPEIENSLGDGSIDPGDRKEKEKPWDSLSFYICGQFDRAPI
jgi:hypothetical protein